MARLTFPRKLSFSKKRKKANSVTPASLPDSHEFEAIKRKALRRWQSYTPSCNVLISSKSPHEELHRLFPFIPKEEFLLNVFTCALSKDILLQGKMFVTQNWICFYSNIFGFETKLKIEINRILALGRERTAFVVPNAISIKIPNKRYVFCSFLSRETVFRLLSQTWKAAINDEASFDSDGRFLVKRDIDEIDSNHNETDLSSATELAVDQHTFCSDNDIDRIISTPVFERNSILFPKVLNLRHIPLLSRQNLLHSSLNSKVKIRRCSTIADLRDLRGSVKKRKYRSKKQFERKRSLPAFEKGSFNDDLEFGSGSHTEVPAVRWMKLPCTTLFSLLCRCFKGCTKICTLYFIFAVIILILAMMSLLLLHKINNLSILFAERNANYAPFCATAIDNVATSDDTIFTTKLQRLNNILSSNLQAVHQVKDSLKRLKKDLTT